MVLLNIAILCSLFLLILYLASKNLLIDVVYIKIKLKLYIDCKTFLQHLLLKIKNNFVVSVNISW